MEVQGKLTPLMEQYWDVKSVHSDKIIMFRMGDFFEMFHEDAVLAAPILNIALTSRNKKAADETPMCGVPHHSIAGPISKLLQAGYKVAICDQIEDPKQAKGLVKRAVTRILSPGMVYDPDTLEQQSPNYLCAFSETEISFLDISTGEAFYYLVSDVSSIRQIISIISPVEVVCRRREDLEDVLKGVHKSFFEATEEQVENLSSGKWGEWKNLKPSSLQLLAYVQSMQGPEVLKTISPFEKRQLKKRMVLSSTVLRHLELFKTYKGEKKGSLFFAMDRTKTSAGARLLKSWMCFPLVEKEKIENRLDHVERWARKPSDLKEIRILLSKLGDVERRVAKLSNPNCHAQDLNALADSLRVGLLLSPFCAQENFSIEALEEAKKIVKKIEFSIDEDAPMHFKMGGVIRKSFSSDLQLLADMSENAQSLLQKMELKEREVTGIPSLKIRYNNVFGYYIEVTKTHAQKVPDHYKRKQTLVNAERYLTQELQELEEKILSARSKRIELEMQIFSQLKMEILEEANSLLILARKWSELDVLTSLAWLALEYNYSRPSFNEEGDLHIRGGRHAVVEQEVDIPFVENSIHLKSSHCLLLTGPNMAGKSTLMRQVAVISLMAQLGSFVPAKFAELPLFEKIFTRIGASDHLSEGLSTFMVEMKETAEMLKVADKRTLVILDEVGRGTSTYDGMSLAQAILEYILRTKKSMTLFATHYHELTALESKFSEIHNAHMAIREKEGHIQFLHTLVNGPANRSYGIQVAHLAGLPPEVTHNASKILKRLEKDSVNKDLMSDQMSFLDWQGPKGSAQLDESQLSEIHHTIKENQVIGNNQIEHKTLIEEIKMTELQEMTPLEALNQIAKWQSTLQ